MRFSVRAMDFYSIVGKTYAMTTTATPTARSSLNALVVREIRAEMGRQSMASARLARALGVSEAWTTRRLSAKSADTVIGLNDLERIARVLGVSVLDLMPKTASVQAIAHYLAPTVRTIEQPTRPRDNRPSGHPFPAATTGVRRTAHLPRTTRPKAS
jgi:transcriptional regulator with XRE-family HTH domain